MNDTQDVFRMEVRAWLEDNCPQEMRTPLVSEKDACWGGRGFTFQSEAQRLWLERMGARGWTAPDWPEEYGGGGLNREQLKVLNQEMSRINARPALYSFGIFMLGPALLKFGNEEQKRNFLPPIIRGEIRWVQGYSEPNAGSDLASLQAPAVDMGDHYVLNGSKTWTSYGDHGDWMFCLVRTDSDVPRHQGISFMLFDMKTPGITVRPIKLISGKSPFCEVFFENVRIPKNQQVGELNKGWSIAKYLLTHEREMISWAGLSKSGTQSLGETAMEHIGGQDGKLDDPILRTDIARFEVDEMAFALTIERARDEVKAGVSLGAVSSWFKFFGTELNKQRHNLLMDIGGSDSLAWTGEAGNNGKLARDWLRTKGNSIEGGTSEIQLNIVAKHILGLPG
jgi:alkylation response protein AidB-like acyl-CoA dehydrogenase